MLILPGILNLDGGGGSPPAARMSTRRIRGARTLDEVLGCWHGEINEHSWQAKDLVVWLPTTRIGTTQSTVSMRDYGANSHNGSLVGGVSLLAESPMGRCLGFDGVDDYFADTSFAWPGGPVSVSFWQLMQSADKDSDNVFRVGDTPDANRFAAHCPYADDVVYWDYGDIDTGGRLTTSYSPWYGLWTQFLLTSGGGTGGMAIYADGELINSSGTSSTPTNKSDLRLVDRGTFFQKTKIADFRIYGRVLRQSEARELFNPATRHELYGIRSSRLISIVAGGAGTFTATVTAEIGGTASALTATFVPPTFTGSAAAEIGGIASAATATATPPTFTASTTAEIGGVASALTATFTAPVFTATTTTETGGIASAATATATPPTFTASLAAETGGTESLLAATATPPTFTASTTAEIGGAAVDADAIFASAVFAATIAATTDGAASAATATATPPTFTASLAAETGGTASAASATAAPPVFTATLASTTGGVNSSATGTVVPPTFTASVTSTSGGAASTLTAIFELGGRPLVNGGLGNSISLTGGLVQ